MHVELYLKAQLAEDGTCQMSHQPCLVNAKAAEEAAQEATTNTLTILTPADALPAQVNS
jgi:hypothetical protein